MEYIIHHGSEQQYESYWAHSILVADRSNKIAITGCFNKIMEFVKYFNFQKQFYWDETIELK